MHSSIPAIAVINLVTNLGRFTYTQANNATRKKGFKKGVEVEDARRRRNDTTVQIRKEKKEDQIQKRRAVSVSLFSNVGTHSRIVTASLYLFLLDAHIRR